MTDRKLTLHALIDADLLDDRVDDLSMARLIAVSALAVHSALAASEPVAVTPDTIIVLPNGDVQLAAPPAPPAIGYQAPERLRGEAGDPRSDVFSLGVVLWEALTHTRLFDGATDDALKTAVLEQVVQPTCELNANNPAELDAICKKALARDPADRYQSPRAMAAELEIVLDDAGYAANNDVIVAFIKQATANAKPKLPAPRVGKVIPNVATILAVPSAPVLPANMSTPVMDLWPEAPAKLDVGPIPGGGPIEPAPLVPSPPILPADPLPVRDVLSSWAWSTNSVTALPDDESESHPQLSRKPLFYAIGGAFALLAVLGIVVFAFGGSKKDEPDVAKVATKAFEAPVVAPTTAPPPVANPGSDVQPKVEAPPVKVEPPPVKVEPKLPAKVEPMKKPELVMKKPEPAMKKPEPAMKKPEVAKKNPNAEPAKPKADPATAYHFGLQQFARGDTGGALETLKTSIASSPGFAPSYRGLGLVYEKLGNKALAQKSYKRYLQVAPTASDADSIRARVEKLGS